MKTAGHNRDMADNTDPRIALVTGASSGIGAATARRLAAEGFLVHCAARRTDRIEALADEIGGVATACDVTDRESVAALAERVGPVLHVLVNNAGGAFGADTVEQADPEDWARTYDSTCSAPCTSPRRCCPRCGPVATAS